MVARTVHRTHPKSRCNCYNHGQADEKAEWEAEIADMRSDFQQTTNSLQKAVGNSLNTIVALEAKHAELQSTVAAVIDGAAYQGGGPGPLFGAGWAAALECIRERLAAAYQAQQEG